MTYTYVTCPDCDRRLGEQTYGYACPCGAKWTVDGNRLAWPHGHWRRRRLTPTWARVLLLLLLLSWAVFVVAYMVPLDTGS